VRSDLFSTFTTSSVQPHEPLSTGSGGATTDLGRLLFLSLERPPIFCRHKAVSGEMAAPDFALRFDRIYLIAVTAPDSPV